MFATRRPFSRPHPGREIISEGVSVLQSRDREPGRKSNGAQSGGQWGLERVWHYFGQLSRFEGRILRRPAGIARNHPKFAGIACVNVKLGLGGQPAWSGHIPLRGSAEHFIHRESKRAAAAGVTGRVSGHSLRVGSGSAPRSRSPPPAPGLWNCRKRATGRRRPCRRTTHATSSQHAAPSPSSATRPAGIEPPWLRKCG